MKQVDHGGGWQAILYSLQVARKVGLRNFWTALTSRNACKTCALGMGGQKGGMRNELGHFPEVCKKSMQATASDMQAPIPRDYFDKFSVSHQQGLSSKDLEHAGRLSEPLYLKHKGSHYQPISWDKALGQINEKLKGIDPKESFFYFSGRSSNEAGFLLQLFARLYGTNHINNCSYYCHQASGVGLSSAIGTGTATVVLDDVQHADLFILIGANPSSNHPRLMTLLKDLRRRGGQVVVVNPVRERGLVNFRVPSDVGSMLLGTEIASHYLQPTIGGDIACMIGIGKWLLENDRVDLEFIQSHAEGFGDVEDLLRTVTWAEIEDGSGLAKDQIISIAELYGRSKKCIFAWAMGMTHHQHGVENVQWIVNLALLRGMVGKPGSGLLPIRGHSNVQGMGTVGVTPQLKTKVLTSLREKGFALPEFEGKDTMACIKGAFSGEFKFALCLGGNLYGSNPHLEYAKEAFKNIDLVVYLNTTLNTGHVHGLGKETLILPVLARDEEPYSTTQESMFNFVRLSDGGSARLSGPRGEVSVIAALGDLYFGKNSPIGWHAMVNTNNIRHLMAEVIPEMTNVRDIGLTKKEFQIPGRTFHTPIFKTGNGRGRFHAHRIPTQPTLKDRQLRLMTVRSEGQFNTVVFENHDLYRGQERRDVLLLNPKDRQRFGLRVNQKVTVEGEAGSLDNILVRDFDVTPGCALMYYPEANVLLSQRLDPRSRTPAFKHAIISLRVH